MKRYKVTVIQRAAVVHEVEMEAEDSDAAAEAAWERVDNTSIVDAISGDLADSDSFVHRFPWVYDSEVLSVEEEN